MNKYIVTSILLSISVLYNSYTAQTMVNNYNALAAYDDGTNSPKQKHGELGIDLAFSASNNSGNFGVGLKYGIAFGEYLIAGPSLRYERLWFNNINFESTNRFNTFGGGAFLHARFFNALFLGAEFEMLKSPYTKNGFLSVQQSTWAPSLLMGGGFSMEFNESIRINAGIMYDVINATNSPFRRSYMLKRKNGSYLPILYRIAFFFPL